MPASSPAVIPSIEDTPLSRKRFRWRELLLSLLVTLFICGVLYAQLDKGAFTAGLRAARYELLLPVFALHGLAWWLRTWRWSILLSPFRVVRVNRLLRLVMIGAMISSFVPARAGEFWRAYTLGRQEGFSRSTVFGTIVVERIFDGLSLALLASIAALAIGPTRAMTVLIGSAMLGFTGALGLIAIMTWSQRARIMVIDLAIRITPKRYNDFVKDKLDLFTVGLGALRDGRVLFGAVFVSFVIWAVDTLAYWVLGIAFGLDVNPAAYLLVVAVGNLAIAIPVSLGGVGPFEFFVQQALVLLGVSASVGLAYALFFHGISLCLVVGSAVVFVWSRTQIGLYREPVRPMMTPLD